MCLQVAKFSSGATCMLSVLMACSPLLYVYSEIDETVSDKSNVLQISYMHASLLMSYDGYIDAIVQNHFKFGAKITSNVVGVATNLQCMEPCNAKKKNMEMKKLTKSALCTAD